MTDLALRAKNVKTMNTALRLMQITDADGNGRAGIHIYWLPPVKATKGEYDADGNETKAPTFTKQVHVNVRVGPYATYEVIEKDADNKDITVKVKVDKGSVDGKSKELDDAVKLAKPAKANKTEKAWIVNGIEIVDMETVASPVNVIL